MSVNLLDTIKRLFTSDLIANAASTLGESQSNMEKAVSGAVPSVLMGLLNKTHINGTTAQGILDLAKQAAGSGVLTNLTALVSHTGSGGRTSEPVNMAVSLLGDKLGNVNRMIAGYAGIKETSASTVMNMVAPASLAVVGEHAVTDNINAEGLLSLLAEQKASIFTAIPNGMNLSGALGIDNLKDIGGKIPGAFNQPGNETKYIAERVTNYTSDAKSGKGRLKWLLPLLLVIIAAALAWYFVRKMM